MAGSLCTCVYGKLCGKFYLDAKIDELQTRSRREGGGRIPTKHCLLEGKGSGWYRSSKFKVTQKTYFLMKSWYFYPRSPIIQVQGHAKNKLFSHEIVIFVSSVAYIIYLITQNSFLKGILTQSYRGLRKIFRIWFFAYIICSFPSKDIFP